MSNSNSAVNTSVLGVPSNSRPLEASSTTTTNSSEANSANTSTSCQRPLLSLSELVARSETLESPAYIPGDFTTLPNDIADMPVTELVASDKQQAVTDADVKNAVQTSSDVNQSHNTMASVSIETETAAVSVPAYEKLMPAQQATAGKTTKFAASVRRKFTVSKTVLPSSAAPPVVVFSKMAAEAANPCEVQNVDDVGRVHILDKVVSSNKSSVCNDNLSPGIVDISAVQPVSVEQTSVSCMPESSMMTRSSERAVNIDSDEIAVDSRSQPTAPEYDRELADSTEVLTAACVENVDEEASDSCCEDSTGKNTEMCTEQSEVDSTPWSCAESDRLSVETSTLACKPEYQINDGAGPEDEDTADLQEITSTGDKCAMVPASWDSTPAAVNDVSTASELGNELDLLRCTTDELPSSDASNDILVTQVTDSVVCCSTVAADMSIEASSSLCSKLDTLLQNVECDNSSQITESMSAVPATQCSSPVQKQIDEAF